MFPTTFTQRIGVDYSCFVIFKFLILISSFVIYRSVFSKCSLSSGVLSPSLMIYRSVISKFSLSSGVVSPSLITYKSVISKCSLSSGVLSASFMTSGSVISKMSLSVVFWFHDRQTCNVPISGTTKLKVDVEQARRNFLEARSLRQKGKRKRNDN